MWKSWPKCTLIERKLIEAKISRQRLEMIASLNPAVRKQVSGFIEHG
jgi:hypothetical protein